MRGRRLTIPPIKSPLKTLMDFFLMIYAIKITCTTCQAFKIIITNQKSQAEKYQGIEETCNKCGERNRQSIIQEIYPVEDWNTLKKL